MALLAQHHGGAVLLSRIFTVFAAALLVLAFALGVLAPPDMVLAQGMDAMDPSLVTSVRDIVVRALGNGAWTGVLVPILARPIWLVPLSLGIVCGGVAMTTAMPAAPSRRQRRS